MKRMIFLVLTFWLWSALAAQAATIYIDAAMASDCTSGNYSIANHNCTGSDGNGYNDIQAALSASSAGDTINLRSNQAHDSNVTGNGIGPKTNQTWQTYPGDMPTKAQINANASANHLFYFTPGATGTTGGVTVQDLILRNAQGFCLYTTLQSSVTLTGLDCAGWNIAGGGQQFNHGLSFGGGSNAVVTDNYVHAPANNPANCAGINWGGDTNAATVLRNRVEDVWAGYWADTDGIGVVQDNIAVNNPEFGYFIEARSTGTYSRNISVGAGFVGFAIRSGGTTDSLQLWNNVAYGFQVGGIAIGVFGVTDDKCANCDIANNIMMTSVSGSKYGIFVNNTTWNDSSNTFRNNLIHMVNNNTGACWATNYNWTLCDAGTNYADDSSGMASWNATSSAVSGNIAGDPLFRNAASEDFTLLSGSPAIDAGVDVGLAYNGSAPDIGALETASHPCR